MNKGQTNGACIDLVKELPETYLHSYGNDSTVTVEEYFESMFHLSAIIQVTIPITSAVPGGRGNCGAWGLETSLSTYTPALYPLRAGRRYTAESWPNMIIRFLDVR